MPAITWKRPAPQFEKVFILRIAKEVTYIWTNLASIICEKKFNLFQKKTKT